MRDLLLRIGRCVSPNSSTHTHAILSLEVVNAKLLLAGAMVDREIHKKINTEIG